VVILVGYSGDDAFSADRSQVGHVLDRLRLPIRGAAAAGTGAACGRCNGSRTRTAPRPGGARRGSMPGPSAHGEGPDDALVGGRAWHDERWESVVGALFGHSGRFPPSRAGRGGASGGSPRWPARRPSPGQCLRRAAVTLASLLLRLFRGARHFHPAVVSEVERAAPAEEMAFMSCWACAGVSGRPRPAARTMPSSLVRASGEMSVEVGLLSTSRAM